MLTEALEKNFTVLNYFCDKAMLSTVPTGLLKLSVVFILRQLGHLQKPQKFTPCKNFPLYGI